MKTLVRKKRTRAVNADELHAARAQVARATGINIDVHRLDADEKAELVELTKGIGFPPGEPREPGATRHDPSQLAPKDLRRWEALIERASDKPGWFRQQREERETLSTLRQLAIRAKTPQARARWEERGSVILPKEVFDHVASGALWIEHVGLLSYLLGVLENPGLAREPHVRVENDALVFDWTWGLLGSHDSDDGTFSGWRRMLEHLEHNSWLQVERDGRTWRIRRGPRAQRALEGRREG
jgi:hypothetical protein